jgi:hypothetical protein
MRILIFLLMMPFSIVAQGNTSSFVRSECLTAAVYYRQALSDRLSGVKDEDAYLKLEKAMGNRSLAGLITMGAYDTKLSDSYGELDKDKTVLNHGKMFYFYCVDNFNNDIGRYTYDGR